MADIAVNIKVNADGTYNGVMSQNTRATAQFKDSLADLAKSAITAFAAISAIDVWREFDESTRNAANLTGSALEDIQDAAMSTALEFDRFGSTVADAFGVVGSKLPALLEMPEALQAVTNSSLTLADAAKATGDAMTDADAAMAITAGLAQWNVATQDAAEEADKFGNILAASAQLGSSSISNVVESMRNAGTVAASAGLSFEEYNAAIQVMAERQLEGAEAGTALRNTISILLTKGEDFEEFGIKAGSINPKIVGLETALKNLSPILQNDVAMVKLFGQENLVAAQILGQGTEKLSNLTAKLTGTQTAYEQAQAGAGSFNGQLNATSNLLKNIGVLAIQELFAPALTPALALLNDGLRAVAQNMPAITAAAQTAATVLGVGGALYVGIQAAPAIFAATTAATTALTRAYGLLFSSTTATIVPTSRLDIAILQLQARFAASPTLIGKMNTSLYGTGVAAQFASGAMGKLQVAGGLLFAAWTGWEIGSYLYNEFEIAREMGDAFVQSGLIGFEHLSGAGIALVGELEQGWNTLQYASNILWETVTYGSQVAFAEMLSATIGFVGESRKSISYIQVGFNVLATNVANQWRSLMAYLANSLANFAQAAANAMPDTLGTAEVSAQLVGLSSSLSATAQSFNNAKAPIGSFSEEINKSHAAINAETAATQQSLKPKETLQNRLQGIESQYKAKNAAISENLSSMAAEKNANIEQIKSLSNANYQVNELNKSTKQSTQAKNTDVVATKNLAGGVANLGNSAAGGSKSVKGLSKELSETAKAAESAQRKIEQMQDELLVRKLTMGMDAAEKSAWELGEAMKKAGGYTDEQIESAKKLYHNETLILNELEEQLKIREQAIQTSNKLIADLEEELKLAQMSSDEEREKYKALKDVLPEQREQAEVLYDQVTAQKKLNDQAKELKNSYEDAFASAAQWAGDFFKSVLSGNGEWKNSLGSIGKDLMGMGGKLSGIKPGEKAGFNLGGVDAASFSGKTILEGASSIFGESFASNISPLTDGIDSLASSVGGMGNIIGGVGAAISLFSGDVKGALSGIGGMVGQALIPIPVIGGMIGSFLGDALGGLFGGGEMRMGAAYDYHQGEKDIRFVQGPSGGKIGGGEIEQAISETIKTIDKYLMRFGSSERVGKFHGALEQSENDRGGVYSGGRLSGGGKFGEEWDQWESQTSRTLTTEEAGKAFALDLQQSILQALQAAADSPEWLKKLIGNVDVELLSAEEVANILQSVDAIDLVAQSLGKMDELESIANQFDITTLTQGITEFAGINEIFNALGISALEFNANGIETAMQISAIAGGLDNLKSQSAAYYDAFYSEEEKRALAFNQNQKILNSTFEGLGQSVPTTRAEFRKLVDGLDLTTESGQKTFASLMRIAPAADAVYDSLESGMSGINNTFLKTIERIRESLSAANIGNWLMDSITNSSNAQQSGEQFAARFGSEIQKQLQTTVINTVSEMIFSKIIEPMTQAAVINAQNQATGGIVAGQNLGQGGIIAGQNINTGAVTAGQNLASGSTTASSALSAGGTSAAMALAAGGQQAADYIQGVVAEVKTTLKIMSEVMADESIKALMQSIQPAMQEIGSTTYTAMQPIQQMIPAVASIATSAANETKSVAESVVKEKEKEIETLDKLRKSLQDFASEGVDFETRFSNLTGLFAGMDLSAAETAAQFADLADADIYKIANDMGVTIDELQSHVLDYVKILQEEEKARAQNIEKLEEWQKGLQEKDIATELADSLQDIGVKAEEFTDFLQNLSISDIEEYAAQYELANDEVFKVGENILKIIQQAEAESEKALQSMAKFQADLSQKDNVGELVSKLNNLGVSSQAATETLKSLSPQQLIDYAETLGLSGDEFRNVAPQVIKGLQEIEKSAQDFEKSVAKWQDGFSEKEGVQNLVDQLDAMNIGSAQAIEWLRGLNSQQVAEYAKNMGVATNDAMGFANDVVKGLISLEKDRLKAAEDAQKQAIKEGENAAKELMNTFKTLSNALNKLDNDVQGSVRQLRGASANISMADLTALWGKKDYQQAIELAQEYHKQIVAGNKDRIKQIESSRDSEIKSIEATRDAALKRYESELNAYEKMREDVQKAIEDIKGRDKQGIEGIKENLKERIDAIETERDTAQKAHQSQIDSLEKLRDASQSLRQKVQDSIRDISGGKRTKPQIENELAATQDIETQFDLIEELRQMELDSLNDSIDLVKEKYEAEKANTQDLIAAAKSLKGFVDDLMLGENSVLTNEQRVAEAERQYRETLSAAKSGDKNAVEKLGQVASTYLDEARNFFASSPDYTAIFGDVTGAVSGVGSSLESQAQAINANVPIDETRFAGEIKELQSSALENLKLLDTRLEQNEIALNDKLESTKFDEQIYAQQIADAENEAVALLQNLLTAPPPQAFDATQYDGLIASAKSNADAQISAANQDAINQLTGLQDAISAANTDLTQNLANDLIALGAQFGLDIQGVSAAVTQLGSDILGPRLDNVISAINGGLSQVASSVGAAYQSQANQIQSQANQISEANNYESVRDFALKQISAETNFTSKYDNLSNADWNAAIEQRTQEYLDSGMTKKDVDRIMKYDIGTDYVPSDQVAQIHQGEIIIDPRSSDILRRYGIQIQPTQQDGKEPLRTEITKLNEKIERLLTALAEVIAVGNQQIIAALRDELEQANRSLTLISRKAA